MSGLYTYMANCFRYVCFELNAMLNFFIFTGCLFLYCRTCSLCVTTASWDDREREKELNHLPHLACSVPSNRSVVIVNDLNSTDFMHHTHYTHTHTSNSIFFHQNASCHFPSCCLTYLTGQSEDATSRLRLGVTHSMKFRLIRRRIQPIIHSK